jgi:enamine deaminase RidA (YjgF/YER057c/UK114 family)
MSSTIKNANTRVTRAALASMAAAGTAERLPVLDVPSRLTPISPAELGEPRGWTNGWLAPAGARLLFVAGQTAADDNGEVADHGFVAQFDAALAKSLAVVLAAGGAPEHVVRMTVYVTDIVAYRGSRKAIGEAWRQRMGRHYPAMTLVEVTRLVDPDAVVEIEVTAALPPSAEPCE